MIDIFIDQTQIELVNIEKHLNKKEIDFFTLF